MSEKSHPPSPSRLRQAREDGQVGVSQDAVRIIKLLVMAEFAFMTEPYWRRMLSEMVDTAIRAVSHPNGVPIAGILETLFPVVISLIVLAVLPMVLATITTLAQTKFNIAPKALGKGFEKLNPGANLKQLVSPQKLLMAVLGPVKGGLLLLMVYLEIKQRLPLVVQTYRVSAPQGWALTMELLQAMVQRCLVVLIILLITDIVLQRYMIWRSLRMDIEEVKRDYKQNEGDPMLKGTRKQIGKEIVLSDTPVPQGKQKPSALVVNPEHIAVTLLYEAGKVDVPVVLEAVTDDKAHALRREARELGIPIVKYVPLARHLLASGRPGEMVPQHTFRAVALLFRVIEEYERLAPELLRPEYSDEDAPEELEFAEVDEELGAAMFDAP